MKTILLFLLLYNFSFSQKSNIDYFTLYKGGTKHAKPIKHILFDASKENNLKKISNGRMGFYINKEHFVFDEIKHKITTCTELELVNLKLDKPETLQNQAYLFYKKLKEKEEAKRKTKLAYPVAAYNSYFKIFLLEKNTNGTINKYEVDWPYEKF